MRYPNERRQALLAKLSLPYSRPVAEVTADESISRATLYNWRKQARERGELDPEVRQL